MDDTRELIRCEGGPFDGRLVDARLGVSWPDVVFWEYDSPEVLVGDYHLVDGRYVWGETRIWRRP